MAIQAAGAVRAALDCFAALAMTEALCAYRSGSIAASSPIVTGFIGGRTRQ